MKNLQIIKDHQSQALRRLCKKLEWNPFYADKIISAGLDSETLTLEEFNEKMPYTTREDWVSDQLAHPPYGTNLSYPLDRYTRFCRTSGSSGTPMNWLDTNDTWEAMLENWTRVYEAAGMHEPQRIFFAFSFGPFLGFWTAYDAATRAGHLAIPGGGLSSVARLQVIKDTQAQVLCCTPTYALHLAHTAAEQGIDLIDTSIRTIIVAGEPGGSVRTIRSMISELWYGARVCDHHGMTEVGPVTYECPENPGILHIMENSYYAEVDDGELILTTLRRDGSPLLRYRTGDLVEPVRQEPCSCGSCELGLVGGILGRKDDMVVIRGVNVFPSAIDKIVRSFPGIVEYQVRVDTKDDLLQLSMTIEAKNGDQVKELLARKLQAALTLRVPVTLAAPGSLPRYELKADRWIRNTDAPRSPA